MSFAASSSNCLAGKAGAYRSFYRVHRSYLANLQLVDALEGNLLHFGEHRVPISRQNVGAVRRALLGGRLLE